MKFLTGVFLLACLFAGCHDSGNGPVSWFVDPAFGDDNFGDGSPGFPFRTITKAVSKSLSGDSVVLAIGTYSAASGEVFPILIPSGVLILGDPANKGNGASPVFVSGGGNYTVGGGTQAGTVVSTAFVLQANSTLSGVKITVTGAAGVGVVFDLSPGTLQFCTLTGCGADGMRIFRTVGPNINNNVISSNTGSGIVVFDNASPTIAQNSITSNVVDGVRANDTSTPNLAGGNTLQSNSNVGLNNNTTASTIQAVGNIWRTSTQFSSSTGTYPGTLPANPATGPVAAVAGNNFAITNAAAAIQF